MTVVRMICGMYNLFWSGISNDKSYTQIYPRAQFFSYFRWDALLTLLVKNLEYFVISIHWIVHSFGYSGPHKPFLDLNSLSIMKDFFSWKSTRTFCHSKVSWENESKSHFYKIYFLFLFLHIRKCWRVKNFKWNILRRGLFRWLM